jgi:hypothetical protein
MISEYDRTHIYEILQGHGTWFSAMLIRLIEHADTENREKLRQAYPEHVGAFEDWNQKTGLYANRKDEP